MLEFTFKRSWTSRSVCRWRYVYAVLTHRGLRPLENNDMQHGRRSMNCWELSDIAVAASRSPTSMWSVEFVNCYLCESAVIDCPEIACSRKLKRHFINWNQKASRQFKQYLLMSITAETYCLDRSTSVSGRPVKRRCGHVVSHTITTWDTDLELSCIAPIRLCLCTMSASRISDANTLTAFTPEYTCSRIV